MEYYYVKLGRSNSQLSYWLQLDGFENPYKCSCVTIYFFDITVEEYRSVKNQEDLRALKAKHKIRDDKLDYNQSFRQQISPFIEENHLDDMRFVIIDKAKVYLLKPISEAEDMPDHLRCQFNKDLERMKLDKDYIESLKNSILKVRKVEILRICEKNIPQVVLTLSTVRYLNSGTFRKINPKKFIGVYPAIERLLELEKTSIKKLSSEEVLELLSPHQFETLFFLILTNSGIFSPAWRAGSLPDIDISGTNYSNNSTIFLGPKSRQIGFPPGIERKFQIKRKRKEKHYEFADFTIAISSKKPNDKVLTSDWLFSVIKNQQKTREWLEHSLQWYIEGTEYTSIMDIIVE
jgi:hypothetical protein